MSAKAHSRYGENGASELRLEDLALLRIEIAREIVHDIDCKDAKFRREEAAGLARMIAGIAAFSSNDEDRVEQGKTLFDNLYAAFGGKRPK